MCEISEKNVDRINELEGMIYDELVEEMIFMDKEFFPTHYILLDNLSEEDRHRIMLINTCETLKSDNENYNLLRNITSNINTIKSCNKVISLQEELLSLYEDELFNFGLNDYKYSFENVVNQI